MQCPKCGYESTMAEQASSPDECPACGVIYAKARAGSSQAGSAGLAGAKAAVVAGRKSRREQEGLVRLKMASPDYVSITDVNMPFWSMVQFLVKLSLAAIPAAIILLILGWGFASIISLY